MSLATAFAAEPGDGAFSGKLSADSALLSAAGTQVQGPRDWTVRRDPQALVFASPEGDLRAALLDLKAPDAAAAVREAWARYRPDEKHAVRVVTPRSARDGWDERKVFDYDTSPNERLALAATAMRRGEAWTVLIIDGTEQAAEKRRAALSLITASLRPSGYVRESFAGREPRALTEERIGELRDFLQQAMKDAQVPGVGFAVLEQGRIVYEGGLGVRELGKAPPVDAHTLFMAASNTKGMSTLLLSTLADEGKLRWEQPVVELYPAFRLGDDATTRQVQVRHLVCACTGLPRQDFEWLFEYRNVTPAQSVAMLSTNKPTSAFGEVFQYNNLMASAAGYIGGHLVHPGMELGKAYDMAMTERIFKPLGMNDTTFDMARALRGNHASPHGRNLNNKAVVLPMDLNYSVVPHRPAGGVWTSAHDFVRYVQLEAKKGMLSDGRQLVSADNVLKRREPQVAAGENASYGMGLFAQKAWGIPVVSHGGSLFGYKSDFYLLPETGTGVILLTNSDDGWKLQRPLLRRLLEVLYDGKPEAQEDVRVAVQREIAEMDELRGRQSLPVPADAMALLAGSYRSAELGSLVVKRSGKDVVFDVGEWRSAVGYHRNDDGSTSFTAIDPAMAGLELVAEKRNGKRTLIARDGQHEYVFEEVSGPSAKGRTKP
jgi:CubicO group peptidase (beta-lactamase class C family)